MVPTVVTEVRAQMEAAFPEGKVVPAHTENEHWYKVGDKIYASVTTKTSIIGNELYKELAARLAVDSLQSFLLQNRDFTPEQFEQACEEARIAHKKNLSRAGDWGTEIHDIADAYLLDWIKNDQQPESIREFIPENATNEAVCGALSVEMFYNDHTIFPIASERKVYSEKYGYAGTLDSLYFVGQVYKNRQGNKDCKHTWFEKGKDVVACGHCNRQEKLVLTLGDLKSSNAIFGHGKMSKSSYCLQVSAYDQALREVGGIKCKQHYIIRVDKRTPHYEIGIVPNIKAAFNAFKGVNVVSDFIRSKDMSLQPLNGKQVITL